jgi:valyl-tRNA synthetase
MLKFFKTFFTMLNPIAPHWTEYMYHTYLNPIFINNKMEDKVVKFLAFSKFPTVSGQIDNKLFHYNKYIKKILERVREIVNTKQGGANKKKGDTKGKENKDVEKPKDEPKKDDTYTGNIIIYYAKNFTKEQERVYEILKAAEFEDTKIVTDYKKAIMGEIEKPDLRTITLQFASFIVKEIETYGFDVLNSELPFNELDALNDNMNLIKKLSKVANISIEEYDEKKKPKSIKTIAIPGNPIVYGE